MTAFESGENMGAGLVLLVAIIAGIRYAMYRLRKKKDGL